MQTHPVLKTIAQLVVFTLLCLGFVSCTDTDRVDPVRLRLKQVNGTLADSPFRINTTYTYDSLNRLSAIARADSSFTTISYNNPDKQYIFYVDYNGNDRTRGALTLIDPYKLDQTTIRGLQYYFGGKFNPEATTTSLYNGTGIALKTHFNDFIYTLDTTSKHLIQYSSFIPPHHDKYSKSDYVYTKDNITLATNTYFVASTDLIQSKSEISYVYDTNPNPFSGLFDLNIAPEFRFSRNNVTKRLQGNLTSDYTYVYNQQGLPVKRTEIRNGSTYVINYSYEEY